MINKRSVLWYYVRHHKTQGDTSMANETVKIGPMFLSDSEALALAQLVKRIGYEEVSNNAVDKDEAQEMLNALAEVAKVLGEAGYNPR